LLDASGAPVLPGGVGELHLASSDARIALGRRARRRSDGAWVVHAPPAHRVMFHEGGVALAEVEAALCAIPGVREAAAAVRTSQARREPGLAALVVADPDRTYPDGELARLLAPALPARAIPTAFERVERLPRRGDGALDRAVVAAALAEDAARAAPAYAAPRSALEERIALLWGELLGLSRVGIHDDFFRLGGHSLLATQVIVRLSEGLGIDVPLRHLFEAPTVAQLAAAVEPLVAGGPSAAPPLERAPRDRAPPLSFAQQRLWFLDQLEPGTPYYNMPAPLALSGSIDAAALRGALEALVRRHESLRTTFALVDGEPVQVISPEAGIALAVHDLTHLPPDARAAEAHRRFIADAQLPFDLARGPLIRTALVRLGPTEQVLLLTLHHIISDGWSMDVLFRELRALLAAHAMGRSAQLPELRIQYADFAVWQRRWLSGDVLARQLAYWKNQLGGAPAQLELPFDRPRPAVQTFRGGVHAFSLSADLTRAIKQLAAREQVTLFMALLAGFKAMLYRYTRQPDLLVGTPIANRVRPELESIIGFFTNTLVMRTRLDPTASFAALLARVRDVTLGAYAHQDIPFEKLVEELHPARSLAYNPLFQVMFALQNTGRALPEIPPPDQSTYTGNGSAKFDLTAFVAEAGDRMMAAFEYNTDLFEPATIARMADHFATLLASAAAEPGRAIHELAMLSPGEIMALESSSATEVAFDPRPVHERFAAMAARAPGAAAIAMGERTLNYDELARLARRWARRLIALGVGPDVPVGIALPRSPEMIAAVLAVLSAGGAYVPLDPIYPPARIALMLADSRATLVIDPAWIAEPDPGGPGDDGPLPRVPVDLDHLAYVIYTSGSTGRPKGIAMPHRPLANLIDWQIRRSDLPPGARTLQFASLSFDVSFQEIFATLCAGGTLVLVTEEQRRDAEVLWRLIADVELARLFVPYVALQQLAESAGELARLPSSLREVITAGEQLQITPSIARLFTRLGARLCNQYGPSETHVVTEYELTGAPATWRPRTPIGRPIANVAIHILDPHGGEVPICVAGELFVGGVAPARGYIGGARLTAERFVAARTGPGRLYRTGDRARYLPDGTIEFLGRLDEQLKIRGYRVEPVEIEVALAGHPAVELAAVAAEPDGAGALRLVAYVQHHAGAAVPAAELRAHLAVSLPEPWIPSVFVALDALPLTPTGKLDRRALPAVRGALRIESGTRTSGLAAPSTPIEQSIARIWCELLRLDRVALDDDFFDLGGHSLLATRLISRIRDELAAEVPLRLLFEAPTVKDLALAVVQARAGAEAEQDVDALLAEIEAMSDADAGALLDRRPR
jgi:amino acid adenylation domain-containing protein